MGTIPQVYRMSRKQNKIEVKKITAIETLELRQKVLKPFLQKHECVNPGDEDTATYHFGAFIDGRLVSVATFIPEGHTISPQANRPYRLRGMATLPETQGTGCGGTLLRQSLRTLKDLEQCNFVWCNAREKAFGFYEKLGFQFWGPVFDIKDIGPHKVMYIHI